MIDPMANLDAAPSGGGGGSGSGGDGSAEKGDVIDVMTWKVNLQRIDKIRSVMGIASGCVAGICGLSGLQGLVCFVLLHSITLGSVCLIHMKGFSVYSYTRQSWMTYLTSNLQQSALSFTLFWTLFYGLVYLY